VRGAGGAGRKLVTLSAEFRWLDCPGANATMRAVLIDDRATTERDAAIGQVQCARRLVHPVTPRSLGARSRGALRSPSGR
jgi:hypothetical protein